MEKHYAISALEYFGGDLVGDADGGGPTHAVTSTATLSTTVSARSQTPGLLAGVTVALKVPFKFETAPTVFTCELPFALRVNCRLAQAWRLCAEAVKNAPAVCAEGNDTTASSTAFCWAFASTCMRTSLFPLPAYTLACTAADRGQARLIRDHKTVVGHRGHRAHGSHSAAAHRGVDFVDAEQQPIERVRRCGWRGWGLGCSWVVQQQVAGDADDGGGQDHDARDERNDQAVAPVGLPLGAGTLRTGGIRFRVALSRRGGQRAVLIARCTRCWCQLSVCGRTLLRCHRRARAGADWFASGEKACGCRRDLLRMVFERRCQRIQPVRRPGEVPATVLERCPRYETGSAPFPRSRRAGPPG